MNKKIVALLIVLIAAISIASVCATELTKEQDFDGLFKMKVSENDTFTNISDPQSNQISGIAKSNMAYKNSNDTIFVFVYASNVNDAIFYLTDGAIDFQYKTGTDLVKSEGDLSVFEGNVTLPDQISGDSEITLTSFAGLNSDKNDLAVIVGGNDADLVKEYAKTISFE